MQEAEEWIATRPNGVAAGVSVSPDVRVLRAAQQRAVAAVEAGDVDAYVGGFAQDGIVMPPGQEIVRGRPAIREWIEALFQQFHVQLIVSPQELQIGGDWAIDRHNYVLTATPRDGGPTVSERGKAVAIYRRAADGSWEGYIDCWNADSLQKPAQ